MSPKSINQLIIIRSKNRINEILLQIVNAKFQSSEKTLNYKLI